MEMLNIFNILADSAMIEKKTDEKFRDTAI